MESRTKRKRLSSALKQSCYFENKNPTDYYEEFSRDINEEYLNSVFDASRKANKSFICTFTVTAGEFGLVAVDMREFSDISFVPCFSSEVHVLSIDTNTLCEVEKPKPSPRHKKSISEPEVRRLPHDADVTALTYTNGSLLLSATLEGMVKAWNRDYEVVQSYMGTVRSPSDIQASSKLEYFATSHLSHVQGDKLYGASLFAFSRNEPLVAFAGHVSPTQCVRFHANGMYFATASRDGTVMMWSTQAPGRPVRTFKDEENAQRKAIAFSPDGKCLASTCGYSAHLWDLASGRRVQALGGQGGPLLDVCFDESGGRLATGGRDGHLRIWDVRSADSCLPEECHAVGRPILRIRCTDDVFTCAC